MNKREGGFVLITALVLSILYFALMELMLIDSSRALSEAQRFRAHVVAQVLAENGAELSAFQIATQSGASVVLTDSQGRMEGTMQRPSLDKFTIEGIGNAGGVMPQKSTVTLQGRLDGGKLAIDFAEHH